MRTYDDYRTHLARALAARPLRQQSAFAHDVLKRMLPYTEKASKQGLWDEEVRLIESLTETVRTGQFDLAAIETALKRFEELAQQDEVHAIETDGDIIDFLSGLEALLDLERQQDPQAAARTAECLMNILDHQFTDDTPLSEWLCTPQIKQEFDRQLLFLAQLADQNGPDGPPGAEEVGPNGTS